jgi:bifunctional UDP-N-acetylglucosamine pyrophosphorylase/glucosamine-1-phosphate N-acetyltransferase
VVRKGSIINNSQSENAVIGQNCVVGPFARLRPGTILSNGVKIGNFVEIKNAKVGENTKINHLAYVGDADVGKNCNVGCGAIFVNYNGKNKNKTIVGDDCFIGSNCNIIAPVRIDSSSYICAGTTVTDNVKTDDFVIGRARQMVKENRAHCYLRERV